MIGVKANCISYVLSNSFGPTALRGLINPDSLFERKRRQMFSLLTSSVLWRCHLNSPAGYKNKQRSHTSDAASSTNPPQLCCGLTAPIGPIVDHGNKAPGFCLLLSLSDPLCRYLCLPHCLYTKMFLHIFIWSTNTGLMSMSQCQEKG